MREVKSPGDQVLLFASNFFKHPKMLGSPIPSPRSLIEQLLKRVDWNSARVIVEYGPGVGTITREILLRMHPEATLVVIEMNHDFVEYLKESFKDARLRVVEGSAAEVQSVLEELGHPQADYVISGIPFSTMPPSMRDEIVQRTYSVLQPKGAFLVYQYSRRVLSSLERIFGKVQRSFMLSRVLPVWFFYCWRQ
ncbi:class I SAM-dependent methyltransferase [Pedosphaera parvula]|uniref:class I SAM-dependent methyltransferase n=1 Tax=Pedosphaera parvula TaxID=1032527 RepID=UPI00030CECF5|nr:methyltransferase [Pedosphaera parvula]